MSVVLTVQFPVEFTFMLVLGIHFAVLI